MYKGVLILFLIKIFFETNLFIAFMEGKTPEWVYGILNIQKNSERSRLRPLSREAR